jgi:hypothetical protein
MTEQNATSCEKQETADMAIGAEMRIRCKGYTIASAPGRSGKDQVRVLQRSHT